MTDKEAAALIHAQSNPSTPKPPWVEVTGTTLYGAVYDAALRVLAKSATGEADAAEIADHVVEELG